MQWGLATHPARAYLGGMETIQALELHSEGSRGDIPFSRQFIPAAVFKAAATRIPDFVAGANASRQLKRQIEDALSYSVEDGSVGIKTLLVAALLPAVQATGFQNDIAAIYSGRMDEVYDRSRIEILRDLRQDFIEAGAQSIRISSAAANVDSFDLLEREIELPPENDPWVDSESYVMATLQNIGGKSKANVHLDLPDGRTVLADSNRDYLAGLSGNMIYHPVLAHIAYRVNLRTQEQRDIRLISLSLPGRKFDSEEFDHAVSGGSAWDAIEDPVAEIRRMRGDDA
jgi:hypothetical protein